jgi:hypothetical protein
MSRRTKWMGSALAAALVTATVWAVGAAPSAHAAGAPLIPQLDCVYQGDPHGPLAFFGYDNAGPAVNVAAGPKNYVHSSPVAGPKKLGQPTMFSNGVTTAAFAVGLSTNPGDATTWTVKGPDHIVRSATASLASPACASPPFTPSVMSVGGAIGSVVTSQVYAADNVTLDHARIRFVVDGLTTICIGGGVRKPPAATWYVSAASNGDPVGTTVHLGTPPNDRDFARGHGVLKIPFSQFPPTPPYSSIGASDGWVASDVVPQCNLGNGVVFGGPTVVLPKPPQPNSDAAPYCFVTDTSVSAEVTKVGVVSQPGALGDCPDVTTLPGGGIRWR